MKTTPQLLTFMKIIFWIVFIVLLIQAGALLISYGISLSNPKAANNFYLDINLLSLYQESLWQYTCFISFWVIVVLLKAYLAYLVIQIVSKIDLKNPFHKALVNPLVKISHVALSIGFVSVLAQAHTKYLAKAGIELIHQWGAGQFLFLSAIIFIIAHIFQRGVAIQEENELTV